MKKGYTEVAGDCCSGVHSTQSDGQSRALPKAEAVTEAKVCEKGYAKKCADKQVGDNRLPLNRHEQQKGIL